MPQIGFGLAGMRGSTTQHSVRLHLDHGFRLLDGAEATEWYDDEAAGAAVGEYSSLTRNDLFLVSKVHPRHLSFEGARRAVRNMLRKYNATEYMDLVLVHYPACGEWIPHCRHHSAQGDWRAAYRGLVAEYRAGRVRALGVSNFDLDELDALWNQENGKQLVHVVQDWIDPFHQRRDLTEWAALRGVQVTAYSSFGGQWAGSLNPVEHSPTLLEVAQKAGLPVTSVVLCWLMKRRKVSVIPRSTTLEHIQANARLLLDEAAVCDAVLIEADYDRVDDLDGVYNLEPDEVCSGVRPPSPLCEHKCRAQCLGRPW